MIYRKSEIPAHLLKYFEPAKEIGLEPTPEAYVETLVSVFREVRRVLRDDGVLWLNLGDSYTGATRNSEKRDKDASGVARPVVDITCERCGGEFVGNIGRRFCSSFCGGSDNSRRAHRPGALKAKDLVGTPWRVAFALQADGWYLRSDIIWCLSGGAWVYARTQKGDMPMMVKDLVRLNPATVRLWNGERWTRALGWSRSAGVEERIEITLRSGERIGCTGSHAWPTQRGDVTARDLAIGDVILTCTLPEPEGCAAPPYLTEEVCWLAGIYLAEGSRAGDTIQLSLNVDEEAWLPRIAAVAAHYGGSMTHTIDGNSLAVRLYGSVLAAVIESFIGGRDALDKHLHVKAWRLPNTHLRQIVTGYLDGDGHHDEGNERHRLGFARNYALERDLRTAAARLGATLTLKPSVATYQNGKRAAFRGEWRWARSGHHNEKDRGEVVALGRSRARQFWDIGVEDEPHLFALASGVLTHNSKSNPMPESVTDRPTRAHEYVFLLTKSERYFYDVDAIREPSVMKPQRRPNGRPVDETPRVGTKQAWPTAQRDEPGVDGNPAGRNARSVWSITTQPYKGAHFAVMPEELVRRCILAGTSADGCCVRCGAPRKRATERTAMVVRPGPTREAQREAAANGGKRTNFSGTMLEPATTTTTGWIAGCACEGAGVTPCVVLDPFMGSGTVGKVAAELGRQWLGVELQPDYAPLIAARTETT